MTAKIYQQVFSERPVFGGQRVELTFQTSDDAIPAVLLLPERAVIDPLALVRRLKGTPLLMVHGRGDRTVTPQQAERLYAAAGEPKAIRWWDAGHRLPAEAIEDAAGWLASGSRRLRAWTVSHKNR